MNVMLQMAKRRAVSAHVIVVGDEKGGTGKSTLAMHLIVALLNFGQRVAAIDLDARQRSLSRYIDNRAAWARRCGVPLKIPTRFCVAAGSTPKLEDNEAIEFAGFADAIASIERSHDFVVIDTPGHDSHLGRLAHSMADTLVTPLNDSYVDLDVLGTIDPLTYGVTGESHYARIVREARLQRRMVDGARIDWVVTLNRMAPDASNNGERMSGALAELANHVGFRLADGLTGRMIYRELFPRGLTVLDECDGETPGTPADLAHMAARREMMALIEMLKLPLDERGKQRAAAQAEWIVARTRPLETCELFAN
jgi:chromosome partitioning protein